MAFLNRLIITVLLFASSTVHADMFKCFYADGTSRFSDNNCPGAVEQVNLSLKGSWMMRKPKGSNCKVVCDADKCACRRTKINIFNKTDAVLLAMKKLPEKYARLQSAIQRCRNCRKRRRSTAVNACDLVVYQTVIKQYYKGVAAQIAADIVSTDRELKNAAESCDGPLAAKPKAETPYGELLSCKQQSQFLKANSHAKLNYARVRREYAQLRAGAFALGLELP